MKTILGFAVLVIFLSACCPCLAQEPSYKSQIEEMLGEAENLDTYLKGSALDLAEYDRWFKDFKKLSGQFEKDFSKSYKQKKSFQTVEEGVYGFSVAWNMLSQAKYADDQYKEAITLEDVSYAHKWKSSANEERKKASLKIAQAIEFLRSARSFSEEGN
jgi:hypothetical protein